MPSKGVEPSLTDSGSRVRRDSEHLPTRAKRKKTAEDEHLHKHREKEKVRSSGVEKSRRNSETVKSSIWRRATDALDSTKAKPVLEKKEASRKDSERHLSSRYVYERPIRRQSASLGGQKGGQRRSASVSVTQGFKDRRPRSENTLHDTSKATKSSGSSRPSFPRSRTTSSKIKPAISPSIPRPEEREKAPARALAFSGTTKRPASVIASVMSSSKTKPVKQVECITCMDDLPATEGNYLKHCQHYWCDGCLKRVFDLSVTDVQHMPPKCCDNIPIQPKVAMHLYKSDFRKLWNAKFTEWTTKDRLYCPGKGCGAWIKPEDIKLDKKGTKIYGKCPKCPRKVCPKCNNKYHPDKKTCPDDPETAAFVKTAKENGWQNCGQCGQTIERIDGCHHMKCPPPCNYQFCILCGAKWKSCECPWFTPEMMDAAAHRAGEMDHNHWPADNNNNNNAFHMPGGQQRPRHARRLTYEEELELRREQVRQDEALARRLARMQMNMNMNINFHDDDDDEDNDDDREIDPPPQGFFDNVPAQFFRHAREALINDIDDRGAGVGLGGEDLRARARLMARFVREYAGGVDPGVDRGAVERWVQGIRGGAEAAPVVRDM